MDLDELLLLTADEPTTYHEATTEEAWNKAMQKELESIEKNKTWELIDLPLGHMLIGLKWMFKLKRDSEGNILMHKARLMEKGYVQKQGVDFEESFTSVAKLDTFRLILSLTAHHGWEIHHLDVKSVAQISRSIMQKNSCEQRQCLKRRRSGNGATMMTSSYKILWSSEFYKMTEK
ncbi:uncharacterized protein LOC110025307 [Phalaenopsis equestris]|uniref:uncharacterized protein LOC110025307 n=1 Tax=Phalaenopsis equestris TaxID=78828 RepID=UPI0009E55BEC|nr:uncharacterized protein LOC110025307 [Phalaenopsis equestris]